MKVIVKFLCIACITLLFSCNKIDDLLTFRIKHQNTIVLESSIPIASPLEIITPDIETNSNQEFQNNNTRADLVKDVKLESLKLTITDPEDKTFSFLKSIKIYISADGVPEIELASQENINSTTNTLDLETTNEKLDPYVKASSYNLRTAVVTKETLTSDVSVRANLTFKVTAEPL